MKSRYFTRINVAAGATINLGGATIRAVTENMSLQGLYIKTSSSIPMNDSLDITLSYARSANVKLRAKAVRVGADGGIGFKVSSIDINSFVNLRNFIAQKSTDFNGVMRETYMMADCIQ